MGSVPAVWRLEASCGFVGDQESGVEGRNKEEVSGGNPTSSKVMSSICSSERSFGADGGSAHASFAQGHSEAASRACPKSVVGRVSELLSDVATHGLGGSSFGLTGVVAVATALFLGSSAITSFQASHQQISPVEQPTAVASAVFPGPVI